MRFVRACPTHFSSSQHRQECAADRGSAEAERCSYGVEALAPAAGWTVTEHRERGASITIDLNIACPGWTADLDTYSVQAIDFDVSDRLGPQCDATRRTDFDRSAEIFFLATKFD